MALRITRSIVPNFFTLANLFCGFSAIVLFSRSDYTNGALLILLAAVFDMLDGVMARLTKSASELGVELDSLCDAVSFGVAPSFLLYQVHYHSFQNYGILIAAFPAMAGVYRLARFNAQLTTLEDKLYFRGMPIPSGALVIVSFVVSVVLPDKLPADWRNLCVNFVTIATTLAMVSTIRYDNVPRPSKRSIREHPVLFGAFVLALVLGIVTRGDAVFYLMMLYMAFGALRQTVTWIRERNDLDDELEEDEDDDDEEDDDVNTVASQT